MRSMDLKGDREDFASVDGDDVLDATSIETLQSEISKIGEKGEECPSVQEGSNEQKRG